MKFLKLRRFQILIFLSLTLVLIFVYRHSKANSDFQFACIPPKDIQSYYSPGLGTLNVQRGLLPRAAPLLKGKFLPKDIVISEDVGRRVFKLNRQGALLWQHREYKENIYDLKIKENTVSFITDNENVQLDLKTGKVTGRFIIDSKRRFRCFNSEFICRKKGIRILASGVMLPAEYPRDAVIDGSIIYIADTFGQKISAYNLRTNELIWEQPSVYPNRIQVYGDDEFLVTEEHANRIVAFRKKDGQKRLFYGCEHEVYKNVNNNYEEITHLEELGLLSNKDGKSICAGGNNLYSPNGVTVFDQKTIVVSDTDNHRVLLIKDNKVQTEIVNLNNPTNAIFID